MMKKTVIKKLKSTKGESISEVLVASLIVALAFLMAASLITASYKIIQKTETKMSEYYSARNAYEARTAADIKKTNASIVVAPDTTKTNTTSVSDTVTGITVYVQTVGNDQYVSYEASN